MHMTRVDRLLIAQHEFESGTAPANSDTDERNRSAVSAIIDGLGILKAALTGEAYAHIQETLYIGRRRVLPF